MKKTAIALMIAVASTVAISQDLGVSIDRHELGSGQPAQIGAELAHRWSNDLFHAPQYLPGFPTAATLWPRVVDVECLHTKTMVTCNGYNWLPELGRGEYLMFRPTFKEPVVATTTTNTVIVPGPTVYVEVPVKQKGQ